jgi:hypothetical protein
MADRSTLVVPIVLILMGGGWLLSSLGVLPEIDWVWTLGLAAGGVLPFLLGGWNKGTFVTGGFFAAACVLSVLRQTGRLDVKVEVPLLVTLLGVLMLVAHHPAIPPLEASRQGGGDSDN